MSTQINCLYPWDIKQLMNNRNHKVNILDVRSKKEYETYHIPEAIHLSMEELESEMKFFDKKDLIVTVCGVGAGRSLQAAEKIKESGFQNVHWLCGGTLGWSEG